MSKQPSIMSFFGAQGSVKRKEKENHAEEIPAKIQKKDNSISSAKIDLPAQLESTPSSAARLPGSAASIPYSVLCDTFEKIEATTKRLQISGYLQDYFGKVIDEHSPQTLIESVYLCLNRVAPEYEGKELGIGESLLIKSIAAATGRKPQSIKADAAELGDLGLVAQASKGKQSMFGKPKEHSVHSIFESLKTISNTSGANSQQKKVDIIAKLLINSQGNEAKYVIRSLEGKLRIGLAQQTILIALSNASASREKEYTSLKSQSLKTAYMSDAVAVIKQVFSEIPTYEKIIPALLTNGYKKLPEYCQLSPGIPLKPMLAHPTKSLTEVLNRFEGMAFTCEYKYDGERAQIHMLENGQVMVYSRNSENLSEKYPDIIARMPTCVKKDTKSFVLDCEAVAWDKIQNCILPFQVLSTRKRKDVRQADIQVQVCIFAFDLLYLNGQALVKENLKTRKSLLESSFVEMPGSFEFAKSMESSSVDDIQTFLDASIAGNCEGLMVKTLEKEASYEPSKRSRNWLKVKKDYVNGLGDSLDLVVIGGYLGRGKRTGAYGGYLLACYEEDKEEYQSICKIGTGFSDEDLAKHFEYFKDHIISSPPAYYLTSDSPNIRPDVWFAPVAVWEVKAADLSISPVHKAAVGEVDPVKGISLRFPRFIRWRDDKAAEQATTSVQVTEFYKSQNLNTQTANDEEDFEY